MLKKVGIVVAVSAAGLLAASAFALADDKEVIDNEQVCSAEATSTSPLGNIPEPLTTVLNGDIESCKDYNFQFPPAP